VTSLSFCGAATASPCEGVTGMRYSSRSPAAISLHSRSVTASRQLVKSAGRLRPHLHSRTRPCIRFVNTIPRHNGRLVLRRSSLRRSEGERGLSGDELLGWGFHVDWPYRNKKPPDSSATKSAASAITMSAELPLKNFSFLEVLRFRAKTL